MLTLQDCLDMCDLAPEVVDAVAKNQRLPSIVAAELCENLACSNSGLAVIQRMILDDMDQAISRHDAKRAARMQAVLVDFQRLHPGTKPLA